MRDFLRRALRGRPSRDPDILAYDRELSRLELPPNGDDYNAVLGMLMGGPAVLPRPEGR